MPTSTQNQKADWLWEDVNTGQYPAQHNTDPAQKDEATFRIQKAYARCFSTAEGQVVLSHLRQITLERALAPESDLAALRQLEGQRQLVLRIASTVKQGQTGSLA